MSGKKKEGNEYIQLAFFTEDKVQDMRRYFTPEAIVDLMAKLLDPEPATTIYDPCCGSGTFLMAAIQHFKKEHPEASVRLPPVLYGLEPHPELCAQAKQALSKHSYTKIDICEGDAFQTPKHSEDNTLIQFDYVITNPPWNQLIDDKGLYLAYKESFMYGIPGRFADWGWMQHILASLNNHGRAVILMSVGAITRGIYSEKSGEVRIRKAFIQQDYIDAVIRLPDNLFPDTTVPAMLLLLNRSKPVKRQGQMLVIDASQSFTKERSKKFLTQEGIDAIIDAYQHWKTLEGFSRVITIQEAKEKKYNLNPSVYNKPSPSWVPLEEIRSKIEPIQTEHRHIYTEIAAKLGNKDIADLALSGQLDTAISQILGGLWSRDKLLDIAMIHQHIPQLKSLIEQEIALEEEYKQSLMHGFFTDPTWSSKRLCDITTISSGGNPPSKDKGVYGNEFCWVQIQDLNNGIIENTAKKLSKEGVFAIASEAKLRDMKAVKGEDGVATEDLLNKVGTVLVAKINGCESQGKLGILGVLAATNVEICCIDPRPDDFLPNYLLYYITYIRHTWADYASQTRKEPRITNAMVSDTQVVLPPKEKQQEIVEELQVIDARISTLKSEKDSLTMVNRKLS